MKISDLANEQIHSWLTLTNISRLRFSKRRRFLYSICPNIGILFLIHCCIKPPKIPKIERNPSSLTLSSQSETQTHNTENERVWNETEEDWRRELQQPIFCFGSTKWRRHYQQSTRLYPLPHPLFSSNQRLRGNKRFVEQVEASLDSRPCSWLGSLQSF